MKAKIRVLLAVGLLAGPMVANAFSFTLDNPNVTVVRPTSGFVAIDFFGTLTLDSPNESIVGCSSELAYIAGTSDRLTGVTNGNACFTVGNAKRFSMYVSSDSALGLYDKDFLGDTSSYNLGSTSFDYSVSVVDRLAVPEPGTLALLGLGLAGLGLCRRRKAA